MAQKLGSGLAATIDRLVRWVVVPITGVIPVLVSKGIRLALFAALWLAFGAALALNQDALGQAWQQIGSWPLPLQALVWLLFLPAMAGLWIWQTDWPFLVRLVLICGVAGWNLLVFIPRRETGAAVTSEA